MRRMVGLENGSAYLLVMLALIIIAATIAAVSAGFRTQGNVNATVLNSSSGLMAAENCLEVVKAQCKKGTPLNGTANFTNGTWNVAVSYISTGTTATQKFGRFESKATYGRYRRAVAINVIETLGNLENYNVNTKDAIFSGGSLTFTKADSINLNGASIYATGAANLTMAAGQNLNGGGGATVISAAGMPSVNNKQNFGANDIRQDTARAYPNLSANSVIAAFGSGDVVYSTTGNVVNTAGASANKNKVVVVDVDSTVVNITVTSSIDNDVTIIFRKKEGFSSDFTVNFSGNGSTCGNGVINIIADGGSLNFTNIKIQSTGVVYSNRSVTVNDSSATPRFATVIARDSIYWNNSKFELCDTNTIASAWSWLSQHSVRGPSTFVYDTWHEI